MQSLNQSEKEILAKYFETSSIKLIRLKSQALLMRDSGFTQEQAGIALLRNVRSIQRWEEDFASRRLASIFSGHIGNENASKLTRQQKEAVKEHLSKEPSEYALPVEFWDIPELKKYIKATFSIEYESDTSYYYMLKLSNLSFKYGDKFDVHRDEEAIKKRIGEVREEVKKYLSDEAWEVFAVDEVGVQVSSLVRKAWLRKGVKTVIKTDRSSKRQNYIGMLNQKDSVCSLYEITTGTQAEMIRSLNILKDKYPGKKLCVVWDNAAFHKGKEIQEALTSRALEDIFFINFPTYAPDTNPIEHVWKYAKAKLFKMKSESFEEMKSNFAKIIEDNLFNYSI